MGQKKTKAQLLDDLDTAHATIAALEEELRQRHAVAEVLQISRGE